VLENGIAFSQMQRPFERNTDSHFATVLLQCASLSGLMCELNEATSATNSGMQPRVSLRVLSLAANPVLFPDCCPVPPQTRQHAAGAQAAQQHFLNFH
jgi:hypothetical protein